MLSFAIAIYTIISKIDKISFWILYHIIMSGMNKIELNLMIIDYEYLSNKRSVIIFYITFIIYIPFIIIYIYVKVIPSIEIKYIIHASRVIYLILYLIMLSTRLNHRDFAYSTFLDIMLPNIIQKCLELGTFFAQYRGYFYDFFSMSAFCILVRAIIVIWPHHYNFYIYSSYKYNSFIMVRGLRLLMYLFMIYYFGSYIPMINYITIGTSVVCLEFFWIIIRALNILQIANITKQISEIKHRISL